MAHALGGIRGDLPDYWLPLVVVVSATASAAVALVRYLSRRLKAQTPEADQPAAEEGDLQAAERAQRALSVSEFLAFSWLFYVCTAIPVRALVCQSVGHSLSSGCWWFIWLACVHQLVDWLVIDWCTASL